MHISSSCQCQIAVQGLHVTAVNKDVSMVSLADVRGMVALHVKRSKHDFQELFV